MANVPCNIQAGASLSDPVDCSQLAQINLIGMPQDWTPALLTFQFSPDNGVTYFDLFDASAVEVAVNIRPGTVVELSQAFPVLGKCFLKLRSGSRNNPIAQMEQRTFMLVAS